MFNKGNAFYEPPTDLSPICPPMGGRKSTSSKRTSQSTMGQSASIAQQASQDSARPISAAPDRSGVSIGATTKAGRNRGKQRRQEWSRGEVDNEDQGELTEARWTQMYHP